MQTHQTFTILFWINKSRKKNGKALLYARITINGKRAAIAVNREASILEWDARAQMVDSKAKDAKDINNHLALVKSKLLNSYGKLEMRGIPITAEAVKNEFNGIVPEEGPRMLL